MAEIIELCLFWRVVNIFYSDGTHISRVYPDYETARKDWLKMKNEHFGEANCLKSDFQLYRADCVYPAQYITEIKHYAENTYICEYVGNLRRCIVFNSDETYERNMAKIAQNPKSLLCQ
ncbi:hypothetical protein KDA11_05665 [Candidatus Saccharibacteria bacterium]|nr:hypothetical protein [Candidatus Saccharibacteria bacterium]